jgi:hypothetical protein
MSGLEQTRMMYAIFVVLEVIAGLIIAAKIYNTRSWKKRIKFGFSLTVILIVVLITIDLLPDSKIDNLKYLDWISTLSDAPK